MSIHRVQIRTDVSTFFCTVISTYQYKFVPVYRQHIDDNKSLIYLSKYRHNLKEPSYWFFFRTKTYLYSIPFLRWFLIYHLLIVLWSWLQPFVIKQKHIERMQGDYVDQKWFPCEPLWNMWTKWTKISISISMVAKDAPQLHNTSLKLSL